LTAWCVLWLAASAALAAAAAGAGLTAEQELELRMFTGQLADPSRAAKTKAEAAELLLSRSYPQAADALRKFLDDPANRMGQTAVAEAIASRGTEQQMFVEPLVAMLTGTEPSVRLPAARALAAYRTGGVSDKLLAIAQDEKMDKTVRLVTISALQRVLDRQAVDVLIQLVDNHDLAIRNAAGESLAKLTNIRAFAGDPRKWRKWWSQNKTKPASAWLADLAESLAREKARLEEENTELRARLAAAMTDYYGATAPAMQDKMLIGFLKDPLPDVRLVGVRLTDRRVSTSGDVPEDIRAQLCAMLADDDSRIRRSTALLEANLGDPNAADLLLGRLKVEEIPEVKQGLLTAVGQLKDPKVVGPILKEVDSRDAPVAAAAAAALARVALAAPLKGAIHDLAVKVLLARCADSSSPSVNGYGPALREALLTAMGTISDEKFIPALQSALTDPAATVRLAGVKGLAQLRKPELAEAVAGLAGDDDRGVRQAVLDALGLIAGARDLQTVLKRTDPAVEPDATVREKAWAVAMAILAKADAQTLAGVCDALADRTDAVSQRITLRQMLVANLRASKSNLWPAASRKLAVDLLAASRPAEAAPLLGQAYAACQAAKTPEAREVYLEWVDALLKANDPSIFKAMADTAREGEFPGVLEKIEKRVGELTVEGKFAPAILLAGEVLRQLPSRLSAAQAASFQKLRDDAKARQIAVDRARVEQLAAQLQSADATVGKTAAAEIKAMGDRAVGPLIEALRNTVAAAKPNPLAEKAIVDIIVQIAPKLTGYDPAEAKALKLKRIQEWLDGLKAGNNGNR
jgi:HEAT repeat protein/flagellar biosynthesis/type III secretory pathway protein FliH